MYLKYIGRNGKIRWYMWSMVIIAQCPIQVLPVFRFSLAEYGMGGFLYRGEAWILSFGINARLPQGWWVLGSAARYSFTALLV
jgi:hypothetical protein